MAKPKKKGGRVTPKNLCPLCKKSLNHGLLATDGTRTWHYRCVGAFLRQAYNEPGEEAAA